MASLPVPSVQAMVAATGGADVPPRYLRPAEAVAGDSEAHIPIIDYQRLLLELELDRHGEESARLHGACQDWGFFQVSSLAENSHCFISARLHRACQDLSCSYNCLILILESNWFLQLINHSVPDDVVEGMKASIQQFFQLPMETKKQFAQERGQLEGYGQLFVFSEVQKLDWADILYLHTQPHESRNTKLWPDQPANFRYDCDCDSSLPHYRSS